jgi:RNA polymerase sigma factor (sigma-70 family)
MGVDVIELGRPVRALEDVFRRHHGGLVGLGFLLTGDHALADDLAQEAFARFARLGSDRWPEPDRELAYLRAVVVNLSRGHFRRLAIARRMTPPPERDLLDGADVGVARADDDRAVAAAVRRLPHRQRACIVLRYHAELGDAEIATTLGISVGAVKTHLHRARAALAEQLGGLR